MILLSKPLGACVANIPRIWRVFDFGFRFVAGGIEYDDTRGSRLSQVRPTDPYARLPAKNRRSLREVLSVLLSSAYRKNGLTAMELQRCRPAMMSALQR